jgi:hypothetical protein
MLAPRDETRSAEKELERIGSHRGGGEHIVVGTLHAVVEDPDGGRRAHDELLARRTGPADRVQSLSRQKAFLCVDAPAVIRHQGLNTGDKRTPLAGNRGGDITATGAQVAAVCNQRRRQHRGAVPSVGMPIVRRRDRKRGRATAEEDSRRSENPRAEGRTEERETTNPN